MTDFTYWYVGFAVVAAVVALRAIIVMFRNAPMQDPDDDEPEADPGPTRPMTEAEQYGVRLAARLAQPGPGYAQCLTTKQDRVDTYASELLSGVTVVTQDASVAIIPGTPAKIVRDMLANGIPPRLIAPSAWREYLADEEIRLSQVQAEARSTRDDPEQRRILDRQKAETAIVAIEDERRPNMGAEKVEGQTVVQQMREYVANLEHRLQIAEGNTMLALTGPNADQETRNAVQELLAVRQVLNAKPGESTIDAVMRGLGTNRVLRHQGVTTVGARSPDGLLIAPRPNAVGGKQKP